MSIEQKNIELSIAPGHKELLISEHSSPESSRDKPDVNQEKKNTPLISKETIDEQMKELAKSRKIIEEESNKQDEKENNPYDKLVKNETIPSSIVNQDTAKILANQELINIRHKLPKREKVLSKIIHQNTVDIISEKTANTVARPSGLLGGAILAFIGSLSYLIFVEYVGITYNYLLFFAFFISGFILGLIIELIVKITIRKA